MYQFNNSFGFVYFFYWVTVLYSGQKIIFHQPRFPWNKGPISHTITTICGFWSGEVTIIWPVLLGVLQFTMIKKSSWFSLITRTVGSGSDWVSRPMQVMLAMAFPLEQASPLANRQYRCPVGPLKHKILSICFEREGNMQCLRMWSRMSQSNRNRMFKQTFIRIYMHVLQVVGLFVGLSKRISFSM